MGGTRRDGAGEEVVWGAVGYPHRCRTFEPPFFSPFLLSKQYRVRCKGILFQLINIIKGTSDNFYKQDQLLPENLVKAAEGKGKVNVRWQDGYDHSYFTMATFADDHVRHAARYLFA